MVTPGQKFRYLEAAGRNPLLLKSLRPLEHGVAAIVQSDFDHSDIVVTAFLEAETKMDGWFIQEHVSDDRYFWLAIK